MKKKKYIMRLQKIKIYIGTKTTFEKFEKNERFYINKKKIDKEDLFFQQQIHTF